MSRFKAFLAKLCKHAFLAFFALCSLVPFLWVVISSFKDNTTIYTDPFGLPQTLHFDKYITAWNQANVQRYMLNSVLVACLTVVCQMLFTAMACYVLSRVFRSKALNSYMTLGLMIPIYAMLIPNFITLRNMNLINNLLGLVVVYIATGAAFSFYLLSGFMNTIPTEIDEAAMIDGAGYARTFFSILLPLMKPGLATVATFSFLNAWNEFLFGLVTITGEDKLTLTLGIDTLKGMYTTDYSLLCAGLMFAIVPVTLVYILLQEQVIKGMTAGAVKS